MPSYSPRRERKRLQIIAKALEGFLVDGYGSSSMNGLQARIGGSKATLYAYFPSKARLFQGVLEHQLAMFDRAFVELVDDQPQGDVSDWLVSISLAYRGLLKEHALVDLVRLVVSEGEKFEDLGQLCLFSLTERTTERIVSCIYRFYSIRVDDHAAMDFVVRMAQGWLMQQWLRSSADQNELTELHTMVNRLLETAKTVEREQARVSES